MKEATETTSPDILRTEWDAAWPDALAFWSRFTKLSPPRWCFTPEEEKQEYLTSSFAMIRLNDQAVVVSLRQVAEQQLGKYAREILAHEIGHHVYCPANLLDHGRTIARMRRALPTCEQTAPMIQNLYADLLINDRLQRDNGLDMAGVYRSLKQQETGSGVSRVWSLYMRIYELLWNLPRGTLVEVERDARLDSDAQLGARVIRSYGRDWMDGAGRFAALCLPYVLEDVKGAGANLLHGWADMQGCGAGASEVPGGLAEIEEGEAEGALHPSLDPELSGITEIPELPTETPERTGIEAGGKGRNLQGSDRKHKEYRGPVEYGELLKALGLGLSDHEIAVRYYRERAVPYLIRFPVRLTPESEERLAEGVEGWVYGEPLEDIDWLETLFRSPQVVPGWTTAQRTYGTTTGVEPKKEPVDLYLGVDCSGSMVNPQVALSYPVLAGAIIALSALRAGARVKVVLSGEPGQSVSTDGFVTYERAVLDVLTGYLGTGYAFGIHRLRGEFADRKKGGRPAHILIVTDYDIYSMLKQDDGWNVARTAVAAAGGGGTYVLHMPADWQSAEVAQMRSDGWDVHSVQAMEDLVAFAHAFSKRKYEQDART